MRSGWSGAVVASDVGGIHANPQRGAGAVLMADEQTAAIPIVYHGGGDDEQLRHLFGTDKSISARTRWGEQGRAGAGDVVFGAHASHTLQVLGLAIARGDALVIEDAHDLVIRMMLSQLADVVV